MSENALAFDIELIGRRPTPLVKLPPTGSVWTKPVDYEIRKEDGAGYRWFMVSRDDNHFSLAKSPRCFATEAECRAEVDRLKAAL